MISVFWKHVAGNEGGGELQGVWPAQRGAVSSWRAASRTRVERLLHHARGFKAENVERGGRVLGGDAAGALAAANGCVDSRAWTRR